LNYVVYYTSGISCVLGILASFVQCKRTNCFIL